MITDAPDAAMDDQEQPGQQLDPIWTTSRTARQILALSEVEQDISKLLSLASSAISLLALPQTDPPESALPQGEERSEQFVLEANEYFERLDQIHINMRSTLAHIRQSRIAPSTIDAPPPNFIPKPAGVGTPAATSSSSNAATAKKNHTEEDDVTSRRGLQEERVNRDAWRGILDALTRLKQARDRENEMKLDSDG